MAINFPYAAFGLSALLACTAVFAQSGPPSEEAKGTPRVLPRPDYHFPGKVGRTVADSDPAQFPQPVKAPPGAPNVVVIILEDVGFGQFGTFGRATPTPELDKLAAQGLRYNEFHTDALCSPTRASLITGRNDHEASFGGIAHAHHWLMARQEMSKTATSPSD